MSLKKRVAMNAGANWASIIINAAILLVLVPIMQRKVGWDGYGTWALLAQGLAFVSFWDTAFSLAINRFVAFYRDKPQQRNEVVSASFLILLSMAIISILFATGLSFVIADIFKAIPKHLAGQAQIVCILVGVTLAFRMLESSFSGSLRGYEYFVRCNAVTSVFNLLRLILTIVLLNIWPSIVTLQAAFAASAGLSALLMYLVSVRSIPGMKVSYRYLNWRAVKELFSYTVHSVARSGSMIIMLSSMALLVGWKGTAKDVAIYDIGTRIPLFVRGFVAAAQNVFLPTITNLCATGQSGAIRRIVTKGTQVCAAMTCIAGMLFFAFAPDILSTWLHGDVPDGTVAVMQVQIISMLPTGFFDIWLPTLVGMGFLGGLTFISILMAVLALVIALVLFHFTSISVPIIAALSLATALTVKSGLWLPIYGVRKLRMSMYEYCRDSLFLPTAAAILSLIGILIINTLTRRAGITWLVPFSGSALLLGVIFTLLVFRSEFFSFLGIIKRVLGRK
jgi:O-antigen/teichoic acid export membrane protein